MTTLMRKRKPFGSWESSLTAEYVTAGSSALGVPLEYQGCLLSTESRPSEAGRVALVSRGNDGNFFECLPTDFSIRTRVHEYGGRALWAGQNRLYFCNWSDQRLYGMAGDVGNLMYPKPLTPEPLREHGLRFADGMETPDGAWIIAVAEIHAEDQARYAVQGSAAGEAANVIVAIPTNGSAATDPATMKVLATGADFMSNPRVSFDGRWLSWVQWHHPNMPWDNTELMVAELVLDESPSLIGISQIAGGKDESIVGPNWVRDGRLIYSTDVSGWWNLHAYQVDSKQISAITHLSGAEIGAAAWAIGTARFCELIKPTHKDAANEAADNANDPWLVAWVTEEASDWLAVIHQDGTLKRNETECAGILGVAPTADGGVVTLLEFRDKESAHCLYSATELTLGQSGTPLSSSKHKKNLAFDGSIAEPIRFATEPDASGIDNDAHAFFYAPHSRSYQGNVDELPPLIVMGHGGPTSHAKPSVRLAIQYWTSRGFAVADVNYRGSSGFGRQYRQGLNEAWGVADVEDCVNVVKYLVNTGRVDGARCVIRGGSAGGLTVLRALQTSSVFAAGVSLYGVADLEGLLAETHKFESRYLDNLIGRYPEHAQRYKDRSPIHHAHDIKVPLLVLQGDEDKVVPPSQSTAIVEAVSDQNLAHAYVVFKGEQHGWRKAETLIRALELELWFYGAALGFVPNDDIEAPPEAKNF